MTIAILAMQGAFLEHGQMLDRLCLASFYHFYKICMHPCIIIQFRMKRSCKLAALSCGHNFSIYYGKYLCLSVDIVNIRCTDECHWNLSNFFHLIFCIKASKLSSIRIPLCQNIHRTKTWNSVFHPLCQKDQSGAGSEYRKPVLIFCFNVS